jgi:hypothetical protein
VSEERKLKVWHDDIRRPPDNSWIWVRTNQEAMRCISLAFTLEAPVHEISMDHDLGLHNHDPDVPDADMQMGWDEENDGFELVKWMVEHDYVPEIVTIHSWNPDGAKRMADYLRQAFREGVICRDRPLCVHVKRFERESVDSYPESR